MTSKPYGKRTHRNVLIIIAINSLLSSSSFFGYNGKYCIVGCAGLHTVEAAEDGRRQKRKQYEQEQPRRNRSSGSTNSNNNRRNNSSNNNRSRAQEKQSNDYYDILNVKKTSKLKDIKKAYRKLALKYHVSYSRFQLSNAQLLHRFYLLVSSHY